MAAPLTVSIPHSLGRAEALSRLKSGLEGLPQVGVVTVEQQAWADNKMTFLVRAQGQSVGEALPGEAVLAGGVGGALPEPAPPGDAGAVLPVSAPGGGEAGAALPGALPPHAEMRSRVSAANCSVGLPSRR